MKTVIYYMETSSEGIRERIPVMMIDATMILSPNQYESGYDRIFSGYTDKRLYALFQGKAFLVWPRD